jgi:hypothetical protein
MRDTLERSDRAPCLDNSEKSCMMLYKDIFPINERTRFPDVALSGAR